MTNHPERGVVTLLDFGADVIMFGIGETRQLKFCVLTDTVES